MIEPDLLIRIDENVKYLVKARVEDKAAFEAHVVHDDKIVNEYIKPMWEARQQAIGAENTRKAGYTVLDFLIQTGVSIAAAIAAVKALK